MSIKINGRTFQRGDSITLNRYAEEICHAPAGLRVIIHRIRDNSIVGLYSPDKRISEWGDLDGEVNEYRGWWIPADRLSYCIEENSGQFEIGSDIDHKGVQLKGKPCKILASMGDGSVFVEFEEDVSGCSADGLGKAGRCVAVNPGILIPKTKREKHAK